MALSDWVRIIEDPDLGPDVFWFIDDDGVPLGIGLVPTAER